MFLKILIIYLIGVLITFVWCKASRYFATKSGFPSNQENDQMMTFHLSIMSWFGVAFMLWVLYEYYKTKKRIKAIQRQLEKAKDGKKLDARKLLQLLSKLEDINTSNVEITKIEKEKPDETSGDKEENKN